ncbi:MAG: RecQ family ATP-dependent DNA helicase [Chitinophagaceae bacterium]
MNAFLNDILKQYWGFTTFRPLQEDIIQSVLDGHDTLALMPTGGGKSLCYQIPALARPGLCLVISPLIALMKDQVENLRKKNITAFAIYAGMSRKEVISVLKTATNSNCKFLYVSPERLETSLFKEYLPGMEINLIAVDEAHCISQWGYDFRPPYLRIASLREELPGVPVLALTASATPVVQQDIQNKLSIESVELKPWRVFQNSFERKNLSYSVFKVDSKINKIIQVLQNVNGCAIVYCKSRKRTKEICELLRMQNISADYYHAGLEQNDRYKKQEDWITDKTRVIVCTNAFGMGIDKPNVRTVIHADPPDCLENYYQEAGRAGRDGNKAYAVLLFDENDLTELKNAVSLRFPGIDEIRNVYQAVSNYLQIPSGTGEGQYFDFDLNDFIKKFKLNSFSVIYCLKALEQDGWLSFNEQVFLPSTVQFICDKDSLYQFEKDQSSLEPTIKALLRAYEGIFEYPASISELMLARLLKKEADDLKKELIMLHQYGIINYRPQKDSPQILFLRSRIKTEDLVINLQNLEKRKANFLARVNTMIEYLQSTLRCRSQMIGAYFGDDELKPCGVCDNCLNQKAIILSEDEFKMIHNRINDTVKSSSIHCLQLLQSLKGIQKEKTWKVLRILQAENKIILDKSGFVSKR